MDMPEMPLPVRQAVKRFYKSSLWRWLIRLHRKARISHRDRKYFAGYKNKRKPSLS